MIAAYQQAAVEYEIGLVNATAEILKDLTLISERQARELEDMVYGTEMNRVLIDLQP